MPIRRLMTGEARRHRGHARRLFGAGLALVGLFVNGTALAQSSGVVPAATSTVQGTTPTPANAPIEPAAPAPAVTASAAPAPAAESSSPQAKTAPATAHVEAPELAQGAPIHPTVTPAPAVKPPPLDATEFEPTEVWYGWQNLIVDASVIGQLVLATNTNEEELAGVGLVTYLVGSPIVHWAHGNVGAGFGSLGMRAAAFSALLVGTIACAGNALGGSSSDGGCVVAFVGLLGVPAAVAVDAAVLAYDEVPAENTSSTRLLPWVSNERKAAGVNWIGRF